MTHGTGERLSLEKARALFAPETTYNTEDDVERVLALLR
jgi:hypothetical protein